MFKFMAIAFVLTSSTVVFADYNFLCTDKDKNVVGSLWISQESHYSTKEIESCSGGFGDPVVCEKRIVEFSNRKAKLTIRASETSFNMVRGFSLGDPDNLVNYAGDGVIVLDQSYKTRVSYETDYYGAYFSIHLRPDNTPQQFIHYECRIGP